MSFPRIAFAAVLATTLAAGAAAHAGTRVSKAGGVSIELSDDWKVEGNDQLFAAEDAAQEMGLLLMIVDQADAKAALGRLDKQFATQATDIKWSEKPKAMTLNGMKGISLDGSATVKGKAVVTTVVVLGPTGTNKTVILFAGAQPGWMKAHGAELLVTFKSLKPVK